MSSFSDLNLSPPVLRALHACGYETPTPIQAKAIPSLLAGRDLLGVAQTGTGKTAAFALPIIEHLSRQRRRRAPYAPHALILTPTRELASQIADNIKDYTRYLKMRTTVIFGGVGQQKQVDALERGLDVLVATPGRLLDLMGQRYLELDEIEKFVLDEADRMLDMGFIHDVRKVIDALPPKRQSLLFSATMPKDIIELSRRFLDDPLRVEVTPPATTVEKIDQHILLVEKSDKRALLKEVVAHPDVHRALVFTRTKHGANRAAQYLTKAGLGAEAIHGNKSQSARERALSHFRSGRCRILVATDIAARGIDVPGISHVINFDLPNIPESYVHRIGRTARAGESGVALSFCDVDERAYLRDIERLIRMEVPIVEEHPFKSSIQFSRSSSRSAPGEKSRPGPSPRRRRPRGRRRRR